MKTLILIAIAIEVICYAWQLGYFYGKKNIRIWHFFKFVWTAPIFPIYWTMVTWDKIHTNWDKNRSKIIFKKK